MNRRVALIVASLLAIAPVAHAQDEQGAAPDETGWSSARLPATEAVGALVKGVAVGPDSIVAVGQRTCVITKDDELGRCWGQPWTSLDGVAWDAIEARTSGLDLGMFEYTLSGPEFGLDGVAYGPAGFVAFGWAGAASSPDSKADRRAGMEPALWRSDDGASWSRLPTPESFSTEGLMLTGPWLRAIAGTDYGYVLGGTIYDKPAPRAAIWFSSDGLDWAMAGPDEAFDVGAYIDTMEVPVAGGISSIVTTASSDSKESGFTAVGSACPRAEAGAGPKGREIREFDWTTGECSARIWKSDDGMVWEASAVTDASGVPIEAYHASTVATTGDGSVMGVYPRKVLFSEDDSTWAAASERKLGRQRALAASAAGFHAFVPKCKAAKCRRKTLVVWSSSDGASWQLEASQPTMATGVEDIIDVDVAPFGDRTVVTVSYWGPRGDDFASMALLSPPWVGSTPRAGEGQRLEFEEPGFAVTVPADWEIDLGWSEWEAETTWAVARKDAGKPSEQSCVFSTGGIAAAWLAARTWTEPAPLIEWLDLPGGRALLYEEPPDPSWPLTRYYIFDRGATPYAIVCFATEPPEDRWLPVAASFQFLSDDPQVVHVRSGVTMTFPIEWKVLDDRGQLAGAPGWEKVRHATDGEAICRVAYDTRASDPGQALTAEELRAEFRDYVRLSTMRSVEPLTVDLPVGPALRADWSAGSDDYAHQRSLYQVPAGETTLRVACLTMAALADAPDDRWLSVVETLERLPGEG